MMDKINNGVTHRIAAARGISYSREPLIKAIETESATKRLEHRNHWNNEDLDISPQEYLTWV